MQITVEAVKVLKTGTNDYGKWKLVKVVTDKDIEYTTLAKEAESIKPGMVIDIDELSMEVKDDKERWSFKKFKVIEGDEASLEKAPYGGSEMTNEMWSEKQRVERDSIEAQVAYKGGIELASKALELSEGKIVAVEGKLGEVIEATLDWALARLKPSKQTSKPAPKTPVSTGKASNGEEGSLFKNVGELLGALNKKGISRAQALVKWGLTEDDDLTKLNLQEAWETATS